MTLKAKPTVKDILDLRDDCKHRYEKSLVLEAFKEDEQYYECDIASLLNLPKEFHKDAVVLPTGRFIIDTAVDNTNIFNPVIKVPNKETGHSWRSFEDAEIMRKGAAGLLWRNNTESPIAPLWEISKHQKIYGLGVAKTIYSADRYMTKPDRKQDESENDYAGRIDEWRSTYRDELPVIIQPVHPANYMTDPYYDGGMFVFENREELVFNVNDKFPWWHNPKGKKLADTVDHTTFFSNQWRCELFDDEPVATSGRMRQDVMPHTYGCIPYVGIESGLGNRSQDNNLTKRYVGMLRYIHGLLLSESRNYSKGDIILKRGAFPWYLVTGDMPDGFKLNQMYGSLNAAPEGVKIEKQTPDVPPEALITWVSLAESILASLMPRAIRGLGESNVRSGSHQRSLADRASTMYAYSNESFRNGAAKILTNCFRILKNVVPGDLHVWAQTPNDEVDVEIKKDMLKEPFTFYVKFNTMSDEENYTKHDDLIRTVQGLGMPPQWAWAQMDNVDVKAMEKQIEWEKFKADPALAQVRSQARAARLQMSLQRRGLAAAIQSAGLVPQGAPQGQEPSQMMPADEMGRRAVPPNSPKPQPGSAGDMQNRLRNIRSPNSMTATQGIGFNAGGNKP